MKTQKAPLEKKRPLFFTVGLVFALSLTLVSFEWRTPYEVPVTDIPVTYDGEEPIWISVTLPEPRKQLERPAPPKLMPDPLALTTVDNNTPIAPDNTPDIYIPVDMPTTNTKGSDPDVPDPPMDPVSFAAVMPAYCGGDAAMFAFLSEELKYPEIPRVNGVSGTVHVQFVVGKDGRLRDAKVMRPIDPWLDAEALRVAEMLDCFTPGKQGGRNVDVYFVLPVKFSLGR
jgi:protein TonB